MQLRSQVAMPVVQASATAQIRPLTREPPYATTVALKKRKDEMELLKEDHLRSQMVRVMFLDLRVVRYVIIRQQLEFLHLLSV